MDSGVIVWNSYLPTTCRLTQGDSTLCLYSESDFRLSCPELQMSITKPQMTDICNMKIFNSQQGLLFTTDRSGALNPIAATSSMVQRATRVQIERKKRSIPPFDGFEEATEITVPPPTNPTTLTPVIVPSVTPPPFTGPEIDEASSDETFVEQYINQTRPIITPANNFPNLTHLPIRNIPTFTEFLQNQIDDKQIIQTSILSPKMQQLILKGTKDDVLHTLQPGLSRNSSKIFTSPEVNAKLQFLYQMVLQNLSASIQEVHQRCCENSKNILAMLRTFTENRLGNIITRVLLPDHRYLIRNLGDIMELRPCQKITQYIFLPRNTTLCTRNFPVQFKVQDEIFNGYLSEMSHQLTLQPEPIPCDQVRQFYFDTEEDGVILLTNTTTTFSIPFFPTSHNPVPPNTTMDPVFHAQGSLSIDQLNNQDSLLSLIQAVQQPTVENLLRTQATHQQLSTDQLHLLDSLYSLTMRPIYNLSVKLFSTIFLIVALYITFRVIWCYRKPLAKFFRFICCFCCKKKTVITNATVLYTEMQPLQAQQPDSHLQFCSSPYNPSAPPQNPVLSITSSNEPFPLAPSNTVVSVSCPTQPTQIELNFQQAILRDDVPKLPHAY